MNLWYRLLTSTSTLCGSWFFNLVARLIATGFFLFAGKRVKESKRFYASLFPERSGLYHLLCTFRQFQNFTTIHFDRFLSNTRTPHFHTASWPRLQQALDKGGVILLMSHLGNWEMAAQLLKEQQPGVKMLLYMGVKAKEGLEGMQKEELQKAGITIIGEEQAGGSPFSAVEGVQLLRQGGIVSLTGDIVWRDEQRAVEVNFLGQRALLPEAPYIFALTSGSPIFAFFVFRSSANKYNLYLSDAITIQVASRSQRRAAIQAAAQAYADELQTALRQHPYEWYHFDRFLLPPPEGTNGDKAQ